MKRSAKMGLGLLLIGMLIGIAILLLQNQQKPNTVEAASVKIVDQIDQVDQLAVQASQSFTITREAEHWMTDSELDVDQAMVEEALAAVAAFEGKEVDVNKKDYGLDFPRVVIQLSAGSTDMLQLAIGDMNSEETKYYVEDKTNQTIYLMERSLLEAFPFEKQSYLDNDLLRLRADQLDHIEINNGTEVIELTTESPLSEAETRANVTGWLIHGPYKGYYHTSYTVMSEMLNGVEELQINEWVEKEATNLAEYGLDTVDFSIMFEAGDQSETLRIGDPAANGNYYAQLAGSESVFTVQTTWLNSFSYPAEYLHDGYVKIMALDTLKKLTVQTKDQVIAIDIAHQLDDQEEVQSTFSIDGKELEEKPFRQAYQYLAGLQADGILEYEVTGDPEVVISYELDETAQQINVSFLPYNQTHYAVYVNDVGDFIVSKDDVHEMLTEMQEMIAGTK